MIYYDIVIRGVKWFRWFSTLDLHIFHKNSFHYFKDFFEDKTKAWVPKHTEFSLPRKHENSKPVLWFFENRQAKKGTKTLPADSSFEKKRRKRQ